MASWATSLTRMSDTLVDHRISLVTWASVMMHLSLTACV